MDHLAIMNKRFINKLLSGEKTIESRWSKFKRIPFRKVAKGDTIYFKISSGPVLAKANATKINFYHRDLDIESINEFVSKNYKKLGLNNKNETIQYLEQNKEKKYGTFITLSKIENINPFNVSKKGHGIRSSWIIVPDINFLKIK